MGTLCSEFFTNHFICSTVKPKNRRFRGVFQRGQELSDLVIVLSAGPQEKPLEIAEFVFYCIKNGSERTPSICIFRGMVRNKITKFWVFFSSTKWLGNGIPSTVPEFIDPRFRENKPKTLVFSHWKRAFWACFRENWVCNFGHWRVYYS
jgi:hypothetical protein